MLKKAAWTLLALILIAGSCSAFSFISLDAISSIDVQLGTWNGLTFSMNGLEWNTYGNANWAVGVTHPAYGDPLLDSQNNVDLPNGEYYLYMAQEDDFSPTAIQITLGYATSSVVEVFTNTSSTSPEDYGPYTRVSGSGFTANLVTGPQSTYTAVGEGQVYSPAGYANWIVDINSTTPEPGSWMLLASGFAALIFFSRRRSMGGARSFQES